MSVRDLIMAAGAGASSVWGARFVKPNLLNSVCYGAGKFVAVGASGLIATSVDGKNFTSVPLVVSAYLAGIRYFSGVGFVVVGGSGTLLTSQDGFNWTVKSSLPTAYAFNDVAYDSASGKFVFVGAKVATGTLDSSSIATTPSADTLAKVIWTGTRFVCTKYSGNLAKISVSQDGFTWTEVAVGLGASIYTVASNGSVVVFGGASGTIFTSTANADVFTQRTSGLSASYAVTDCVWDNSNSRFVATSEGGLGVVVSSDGVTWSAARTSALGFYTASASTAYNRSSQSVTIGTGSNTIHRFARSGYNVGLTYDKPYVFQPQSLNAVKWVNNGWVIGGATTLLGRYETNGDYSLVFLRQNSSFSFAGVAYNGSRVVAVGGIYGNFGGIVATSDDYGTSWIDRTAPTANYINSIAFGNSTFVICCYAGTIFTSPDGVTWTARTSGTTNNLDSIVWTGSQFVVVGASGTILTSPDGVTWTARTSGTALSLNSVSASPSLIVAGGASGTILTSQDGVVWVAAVSGTTQSIDTMEWSGTKFIASALTSGVISSVDGANWSKEPIGTSDTISRVGASGSNLIALNGNQGQILTSPPPPMVSI